MCFTVQTIRILKVVDVLLQIEDPCKIYKINDLINTADPTREMVPTDSFTELIDPDLDRLRTEIFKPVTFS